jgi:pyrrolidone-carboxylate peptidase
MKILLTGFEPFGGDAVNSSHEVVRTLSCDESGDIEVVTRILPVKKLRDCLIHAGIPAKTSSSAGLYVCNRTYFAALHHIASTGRKTKAVFIHLPKISAEWPTERMKTAIEKVITMLKL